MPAPRTTVETERSVAEVGARFRAWRDRLGLGASQLERIVDRAHGTVAQIENGKLTPLDREACDRVDVALERDPGATWGELAPLRMVRFDADLAAWHDEEVNQARGFVLSDAERALVEALRELPSGEGDDLARAAAPAVRLLASAPTELDDRGATVFEGPVGYAVGALEHATRLGRWAVLDVVGSAFAHAADLEDILGSDRSQVAVERARRLLRR